MLANVFLSFLFVTKASAGSYATIISDSNRRMWDLSLEQARLEAQNDCVNHDFCDYDIISRARRIYACQFYGNSKRTLESFNCSLKYREEQLNHKKLLDAMDEIQRIAGSKYTAEIFNHFINDDYKLCNHRETESIILYRNSVFYIYSNNRKWTVDKMEPEKFEAIKLLFKNAGCN
jgi:hypothetical protein